jgi:pimeloyl-ACP methyl ester carboxylesterase
VEKLLRVSDDLELLVRTVGRDGPVVFLLHGLASNSRLWDPVGEILGEKYQVIAVDLPGHGRSTGQGRPNGIDQAAQALELLMQKMALRPRCVVGQSWGASVAARLAATAGVEAVVAVDGVLGPLSERFRSKEEMISALRPAEMDGLAVSDVSKRLENRYSGWPIKLRDWVIDATLSSFRVENGRVYRALPIPDHLAILEELYRWDMRRDLDSVRGVVAVMVALDDGESEGKQSAALQMVKGLKPPVLFASVHGDHDIHAQQPELVSRFIEAAIASR